MDIEISNNTDRSIEDDDEHIDVLDMEQSSNKNTEAIIPNQGSEKISKSRSTKLPIARVRHIMKTDPECQLISSDAALVVTKATELFLQNLASQIVRYTLQNRRKTVLKRDFDAAIESNPKLCFLDGTID